MMDIFDLLDEINEEEKVVCRVCGCSEDFACAGGCHWVEENLCSKCAQVNEMQPEEQVTVHAVHDAIGDDQPVIEISEDNSEDNEDQHYVDEEEEESIQEKKKEPIVKKTKKPATEPKEDASDKGYAYPFILHYAGENRDISHIFEDGVSYSADQITKALLRHQFYEFSGSVKYDYIESDNVLVPIFQQHKKG